LDNNSNSQQNRIFETEKGSLVYSTKLSAADKTKDTCLGNGKLRWEKGAARGKEMNIWLSGKPEANKNSY